VEASAAVMVGDSWANDIAGAVNAGIRAVWFNPDRKRAPGPPAGVAEIHALAPAEEILPLLLGAPSPADTGVGGTGPPSPADAGFGGTGSDRTSS